MFLMKSLILPNPRYGLLFLQHHQVAEDQEEAVAGDIKSFPVVSTGKASVLLVVLGEVAHAGRVLTMSNRLVTQNQALVAMANLTMLFLIILTLPQP